MMRHWLRPGFQHRLYRLPHRLPAYVLNGIAVALGIGSIQLLFSALAGPHAAQLALSGAVCCSLADVPNTVSRTWYRVSAAALLSFIAAVMAAWLRPYPLALGAGVALIGFVSMMTMAWGLRAAAVSFAPILSLVFAMASPPTAHPELLHAGWNALGGVAYLGWSLLAGATLQRRYRCLALVATLRAAARLLQSRAALLEAPHPQAGGQQEDAVAMRDWIKGEADLADRLQVARDLVFADADTAQARRDTTVLLRTIDLRDVLLASRLDLDLLGRNADAQWVLGRVGQALRQIGDALDTAADALRDGVPAAAPTELAATLRHSFSDAPADTAGNPSGNTAPRTPADPGRAPLQQAVRERLESIAADVTRIHALLRGGDEPVPLTRTELQRFVAPEGWPLAALRAQFTWQSPVLRHALRTSLALGTAYFLALALPWASHPHWLVLSVAVVLRGNLEQTLSRRNARVAGTMLGCVCVLALSHLHSLAWLSVVFLGAVGVAHSFVQQRYWVAASAATVMALLQAHLAFPAGGFAIGERVADTVLGAALAWAFSYVLPSWERRHLPKAIDRVLATLCEYAAFATRSDAVDTVDQRLARRRAYEALSALAAALQRSGAEPKAVQVPVREVAALIDHGQRLLAHLSMLRLLLARRSAELGEPAAATALQATADALAATLRLPAPAASTADAADVSVASAKTSPPNPAQAPAMADASLAWLARRLSVLLHDATKIRGAAGAALGRLA